MQKLTVWGRPRQSGSALHSYENRRSDSSNPIVVMSNSVNAIDRSRLRTALRFGTPVDLSNASTVCCPPRWLPRRMAALALVQVGSAPSFPTTRDVLTENPVHPVPQEGEACHSHADNP